MSLVLRLILLAIFAVALPLALMTAIRIYAPSLSNREVYYIGAALSLTGFIFFLFLSRSKRTKQQTTEIRDAIEALQRENQAFHYAKQQDLAEKDISTLGLYKIVILAGICIVGLFSSLLVQEISTVHDNLKIVLGVLIFLAFIGLARWLGKRIDYLIAKGKKTVVRGIITGKNTTIEGRRDQTKHWLYMGDHRIAVNMFTYGKYHVGDAAEFHHFENFGNFILQHHKLDHAGVSQKQR
jgi:hypothetical protein